MDPSLADNVNVSKMHAGHIMKPASSLSTESSEFEFDASSFSELNDEPPLSPKLLNYSPNYSPNYSLYGERARDMHASKADYMQQQGFDDHLPASFTTYSVLSVDNHIKSEDYEAPPSVLRINHESANGGEEKKRTNLRSLLNRRDLEQLPPLTNYNNKYKHQIHQKVPVKFSSSTSNSSSASPSSSPVNYHANHHTNHPDCAGDASPPESKRCQKKSRKWAFKLDFLRKGPSPRADDQALNQSSCNDKKADYCSFAAATEEAAFDGYLHERDINAAAPAGEGRIINNYQLNQTIDHYGAAAAAAAAGETATRFNPQINQSIDNYRVEATVITNFESPRHSTCSVISLESSSPRRPDNKMISANHRKISKSAPISPARSPPRSVHAGEGEGALTHGRAPMSPHALHYQQQRARNEELRRKTFLPYRQSLLSACFFPPSTHRPPQAVY